MNLKEKMTALADAVRAKAELTETLTIDEMTAAVNSLVVNGVEVDARTLTVTPSKSQQNFTSSELGENAYYGTVTVEPIPSEYVTTDDATAASGDILTGKTAYVDGKKVTGSMKDYGNWEVEFDNTRSFLMSNVAGGYFNSIKVTVTPKQLTVTPGSKVQVFNVEDEYEFNAFYTQVTVNPIPSEYIITNDATADASNILKGKTAYVKGIKVIGTLQSVTATLSGNVVTVPQGFIAEEQTLTVPEAQAPTLIKNTVTIHPGYIRETQTVTVGYTQSVEIYTPGTSVIIIPAGGYLTGDQVIRGDANLTSDNIKSGVTIFDVEGTFTSDADANASDIAAGKTAYVKGEKLTGSLEFGYYKCAFVDTEGNTWKGYEAILSNGVYYFSKVLSDLSYGEGFTPSVNGIYDKKALVQVKSLYQGIDQTLVFRAPLQSASTAAETGQSMSVSGSVEYRDVDSRQCAYFDGNSKLVITNVSALPFGSAQHTICGWFRYSEFNPYSGLLGYGYEYAIRAISRDGECDVVYYENTGGAFSYHLETDRWYHIATTWDGVTLRLYIDGVITSTNSEAPSFYRSEGNPLWIGGVPRTGTAHGYVSDVRIYTRALSEEEIAAVAAS